MTTPSGKAPIPTPPGSETNATPEPERVTIAYLNAAFASIQSSVADATRAATTAASETRELRSDFGRRLVSLEWHVFGAQPPTISRPPPPATTVVGRVSGAELDVDAANARALVQAGEVVEHDRRLDRVEAHLVAQSRSMGLVVAAPEVTDAPGPVD